MPPWILLGTATAILGTGLVPAFVGAPAGFVIPFAVATIPFAIRWAILMLQPRSYRVQVHSYRTPALDESGGEMVVATTDAVGRIPGMALLIFCWTLFAIISASILLNH